MPATPGPIPDAEITRALVVGAHPDDIEFGAGGTCATWVDAGIEVTYLICTRGEQGGLDDTPRDQVPAIRQAEAEAAARAVGVTDVRWLEGYRDGSLEVTHDLVRDLTRVIRQVRPERMLIQSPERNWKLLAASHHDHLACGEACLRAAYPAAQNPHAYPELLADEGLERWVVKELWLAADPFPDHHVDVTATFDRKLASLHAHTSQTAHVEGFDAMLRRQFGAAAREAGLGEDHQAESFRVVPL